MKKFNNWMLTHHPLIWNTRFHIMLPLVVVINILFFLASYGEEMTVATVGEWRYRNGSDIITVAILTGVMLLIGWLVFYLRQNAFKSLLPLSKFYLVKEFLIILVIITGLCSAIVINEAGRVLKIRKVSKDIDVRKEEDAVALAKHFLPFDANNFLPHKSTATSDTYADTVVTAHPDSITSKELSYLNYETQTDYYSYQEIKHHQRERDSAIDIKAHKWLTEHREDSVANAINQYLALCKKYGGSYRFNTASHVQSIFATPGYKVGTDMIDTYYPDGDNRQYIATGYPTTALTAVANARDGIDGSMWMVLGYWALCISILLFSFRVTALRIWFIALISFFLLAMFTGMTGFFSSAESGIFGFILLLMLCSFGIAIGSILAKKNKTVAGVSYVLFIWTLPGFVMLLYGFLGSITRYGHRYSDAGVDYERPDRFYDWLQANTQGWIIGGFIFAFIMIIFVMIPLVKKWKANPEE